MLSLVGLRVILLHLLEEHRGREAGNRLPGIHEPATQRQFSSPISRGLAGMEHASYSGPPFLSSGHFQSLPSSHRPRSWCQGHQTPSRGEAGRLGGLLGLVVLLGDVVRM